MWESSFVAMTVLLGGTFDEAVAMLPDGAAARFPELAAQMRDPRRSVRAQALALFAQKTALVVTEVTLR